MKSSEKNVPTALLEVWRWKDEVYKDIRNKTFEEKQEYYQEGINEAVQRLNAHLVKNVDGSYLMAKA